jgi:hypothetical protein
VSCANKDKSSPAIKIAGTTFTADEFEELFKNSPYAIVGNAEARKEFLDNLITRILILKEAEKLGLDKDANFLKSVEFFWQQSLLKLTIDKKTKELALNVRIEDKEVRDYYELHKDKEFKNKAPEEVYSEIKWLLLMNKQRAALEVWMDSLKEKSKVEINYEALNIK